MGTPMFVIEQGAKPTPVQRQSWTRRNDALPISFQHLLSHLVHPKLSYIEWTSRKEGAKANRKYAYLTGSLVYPILLVEGLPTPRFPARGSHSTNLLLHRP